jgi:hypothetical protein
MTEQQYDQLLELKIQELINYQDILKKMQEEINAFLG